MALIQSLDSTFYVFDLHSRHFLRMPDYDGTNVCDEVF